MASTNTFQDFMTKNKDEVLTNWEKEQKGALRSELIKPSELKEQSKEFLNLFMEGLKSADLTNSNESGWSKVRDFLSSLSYIVTCGHFHIASFPNHFLEFIRPRPMIR